MEHLWLNLFVKIDLIRVIEYFNLFLKLYIQ